MCLFSIAQQEESCECYVELCIHRIFEIFSPQLFSVLWNQNIQLPGNWGRIIFLIYMQWHAKDTCWNMVFRVSLNQMLGAKPRTANISAYHLCKDLSLVCPCYVHIFTLIAINTFTPGMLSTFLYGLKGKYMQYCPVARLYTGQGYTDPLRLMADPPNLFM